MIQTKMTQLLGIQHPIMQGGMQHLGTPELAAAVSNAGGLGTVNVTIYPELEDFRAAVRQMKSLTDKPFAVNVSIPPDVNPGDKTGDYLKICAEEGVKIIELAGGNPAPFAPVIKGYGMTLIVKMAALKHAKKAQSVGADMVTIVGYEVAGHPGMGELSSFVLANKVSHELDIPVLLGGGVADGYGLAGALSLGCAGVVMGTRFVASTEAVISDAHKQWIVDHHLPAHHPQHGPGGQHRQRPGLPGDGEEGRHPPGADGRHLRQEQQGRLPVRRGGEGPVPRGPDHRPDPGREALQGHHPRDHGPGRGADRPGQRHAEIKRESSIIRSVKPCAD